MLYLPKITVCTTASEVILDTLSKHRVIPQCYRHLLISLLRSASSLSAKRFVGMWSAKCSGHTGICERQQQRPLSTPPFSSEDFEQAYLTLFRLLFKAKYANALELISTGDMYVFSFKDTNSLSLQALHFQLPILKH